MEWIKNCQMCNDGIVIGVNKYKKDGESERAACRHMAEDAAKEYPDLAEEFSEGAIYGRYRRHGKGYDSNASRKIGNAMDRLNKLPPLSTLVESDDVQVQAYSRSKPVYTHEYCPHCKKRLTE